jgi:hypothetical protein
MRVGLLKTGQSWTLIIRCVACPHEFVALIILSWCQLAGLSLRVIWAPGRLLTLYFVDAGCHFATALAPERWMFAVWIWLDMGMAKRL